jgi:hypothetical protein
LNLQPLTTLLHLLLTTLLTLTLHLLLHLPHCILYFRGRFVLLLHLLLSK